MGGGVRPGGQAAGSSIAAGVLFVAFLVPSPSGAGAGVETAGLPAVVPLEATEPGETAAEPAGDLLHLARWIGEAGVVGLGEAWHGTHTFHRLADRIFRHLVEHEGFTVFALEIDQAHAAILDGYAQGERDDLDSVLSGAWWAQRIFYDEALVELLRWMRRHNEATPGRRLHLAGFDLKQPHLAAERLAAAAEPVDPEISAGLRSLLSRALAPGAFGIFPNAWGFTGTVHLPLPEEVETDLPAQVGLAIRGDGVGYGYVGFSVRAGAGRPARVRWVPVEELGPTGTVHALELEVPASADALEISAFHRGNGTVWFARPEVRLGERRLDPAGFWERVEPRPLMMPALQAMDYRAEVVEAPSGGGRELRVAADPLLDSSLEAARTAGGRVEELLDRAGPEDLSAADVAWMRQLARLVVQAVEWRTLAEPNRDVFLAENLLWLHRTAFPGERILALGHTSHTERVQAKMGGFLSEALGAAYRTVSLTADSGTYRYLGDVSQLTPEASLERFEIDPARLIDLEAAVGRLHPGSFLVRLPGGALAPGTVEPLPSDPSRPDVMVFVRGVEPLRLPSESPRSPR